MIMNAPYYLYSNILFKHPRLPAWYDGSFWFRSKDPAKLASYQIDTNEQILRSVNITLADFLHLYMIRG